VRSFDAPRERSAPISFTGTSLDGETVTVVFEGMTLLVAVKPKCDGCRDFVQSALRELEHVSIVVVSAVFDDEGEWVEAVRPVIVAPDVLEVLDVRWPPFYVLIDPDLARVVTEGVVFGPAQVAREIAPFLDG
jgi:hypothetical protein